MCIDGHDKLMQNSKNKKIKIKIKKNTKAQLNNTFYCFQQKYARFKSSHTTKNAAIANLKTQLKVCYSRVSQF